MAAKSLKAIEHKRAYGRKYNKRNPDKVKAWKLTYRSKHPDKDNEYYQKHKTEHKLSQAKWRVNNPNYMSNYTKKRRNIDLDFRLRGNLRSRISTAIRNQYKAGSAIADLGCTINLFKKYISSKFQVGMTWENYGAWELDHIIPLAAFDLTNREQFIKAAHYTNYQPLWAADNASKGCKYES